MLLLKTNFYKNVIEDSYKIASNEIIKQLSRFKCNELGYNNSFEVDEINIDRKTIEETNNNIFTKVSEQDSCFLIGGDHSLTYSGVKGFMKNNSTSGLVVFDANPNPGNYLRQLIEEDIIDSSKIILIGIRNYTQEELLFLKQNNISYFNMKKIFELKINEIMDVITETIKGWDNFYLSLNLNVADPAFAPGVTHPEPGGLTSRELIYCIQRIKLLKCSFGELIGVKIAKDSNNRTVILSAKLLSELF